MAKPGTWNLTPGTWHLIPNDTWNLAPYTWQLEPATWYLTPGSCHLIPATWHLIPEAWNLCFKPAIFGVGFETLPENLKLLNKHSYVYLLISDFLIESQNQQKLATNFTYFTIQFCLRNILRTSIHSTLWKRYSHNTAKNLSQFTNFPANLILVGIR